MEFAKTRLLNAIFRPTLWKNINEYIQSIAAKYENCNDWYYLYSQLDTNEFINRYYPDSYVQKDKSVFITVEMVFAFLQDITDNTPYYPKGHINEEDDIDERETAILLSDIENHYKESTERMVAELNHIYSDEFNPLYNGREEYISYGLCIKEIKPKQSLLETFIIPNKEYTFHFLKDDFLHKADAVKLALKGSDEEYNEKILSELYKICLMIMDDRYFWEGEERAIKTIVTEKIKSFPDVFIEEYIHLEDRALRKAVWSADTAKCLYNYYCRTYDKEVYNFFLKVLAMIVLEDKTKERWESLCAFDNEDLKNIFIEKYENLFYDIKNENKKIIRDIFRKVEGKEELIFKKNITENDIINFEPYSPSMFLLHHQFYSYSPDAYFLPEDEVFKLPAKSFYKTWLLKFISGLKEEADEYFKGNKSYYQLIIDREPLKKEEESFKAPDYSNIPKDFDFTEMKTDADLYKLDDYVRGGYLQIIQNKEKVSILYPLYRIFKDDAEISTYISKDGYATSDVLNTEMYNELNTIFYSNIMKLKTAEELVEFIDEQKKLLGSLNVLRGPYEAILNNYMEKIEQITIDWDTSKAKETHARLSVFFKELRPFMLRLCSEKEFEEITKKTEDLLATSETLYNTFITNEKEIGDYSVVAINYYRALEYLLNRIFYIPYKNQVLDKVLKEKTKDELTGYYGESFNFICKYGKNEKSLPLGTIGKFLNSKENNEHFISFLEEKGCDIQKLKTYTKQLSAISNLRNECAHPSVISEAQAVRGRIATYMNEDEIKAADEQRASKIFEMIINIKTLFNKN